MQPGAAIADLCARHQRQSVPKAGRRRRAARALGHVFINLAILERPRAETFHGRIDHARIERVDALPGQAHAIERAWREILDQHVAALDQAFEDLHALLVLAVDGDRTLVVVEHGEVERICALHVDQLAARNVTNTRPLHLDYVRAEPGEQLRAGRTRLHVREIENADAFECLTHCLLHYFFFTTLCGLRLPMRPLSLPAAGSIAALMRVGLPESIALSTARFHHLVVARILDEHGRCRIGGPGRVDVGAAVDPIVVEDDDADRQVVAADRLHLHARETEGAVALDGEHGFSGFDRRGNGEAHANAHHAPGADIEPLARLIHVNDAARQIERIGTFVDEDGIGSLFDDSA